MNFADVGAPPYRRRRALGSVLALAVVAMLAFAGRASAAETVLWANYDGAPDSIGFANIDGSGGGTVNLGGVGLSGPEGMAFDSVTGRVYVAAYESGVVGQIIWAAVDGSDAGVFSAPGAPVSQPLGVAVDPVARKIYWANYEPPSIAWANLDGSAGGVLNTTGATLQGPYKVALDPVAGRVYWANTGLAEGIISYAHTDNSGAGDLPLAADGTRGSIHALAVDPAADRIYWIEEGNEVYYAGLGGGSTTAVDLSKASVKNAYGLAFDPVIGRVYLGNYGNAENRDGAIGFADLAGGGGGITLAPPAPVDGPQDPVILKPPAAVGAPVVSRAAGSRTSLTCSPGAWGEDFAGSFVYRAPQSLAYQWHRNGAPIAGAAAPTYTATAPGSYACAVTATNYAGSATQSGAAAVTVKKASYKLGLKKKKVKVKPGKAAVLRLTLRNQGDLGAGKAKVCVTVPKKSRKALKAPKCKKVAKTAGGARRTVKLSVKAKRKATGAHKVTIKVKGVQAKPAKATIKILAR